MKILSLVLTMLVTAFLTACGGGGSSDTPSNNAPATGSQDVAKKALTTTIPVLTDRTVATAVETTDALTAPQLRTIVRQTARMITREPTASRNCTTSGKIDLTLESASSLFVKYENCNMGDGVVINGTINVNDMVLSSGTELTSSKMLLQLTMVSSQITKTIDTTMDFKSNENSNDFTTTTNGIINTTATGYSMKATYSNYVEVFTETTSRINGTVAINNTPDDCGSNGTYTIQTVVAMTFSDSGAITSGEININNNNYVFHSDDTVTITVNGVSEIVDQSELSTCNDLETSTTDTTNTLYSCKDTQSALGVTYVNESGYTGVVAYDCETSAYALEGVSSLEISNITATEHATGVDNNSDAFEFSATKDAAAGTVHTIGTHAKYGDFDCEETYQTNFPITVDESTIAINDILDSWENTASRTNTTCPDWVDSSTDVLSVDMTSIQTITDTSGTTHQVFIHTKLN
jgi:hypothetical protein